MFDNNFGYFGNGIEGYAHYMQSFNNNFSNDDNGFDSDDLYDDDLCYEDDYIKEDVQHSYKIALMCVKYIKEEITSFRDFVNSFLSGFCFPFSTPESQNNLDKIFDLFNEAISFLKLYNGYSQNPDLVAKHSKDIEKFFYYLTDNKIKLFKLQTKISEKNTASLDNSSDFESVQSNLKEKYSKKLKVIEDFIAENDF